MKIYELFVSKSGSDENSGGKASPFASVEKAVALASELRSEYDEIYIYMREGEYVFEKTLELTEKTVGKGKARIKIQAYNGENVSFSGGKRLFAGDFKPVSDEDNGRIKKEVKDKILCLDLKKYGITEFGEIRHRSSVHDVLPSEIELFVDGNEAKRVVFPKNGKRIKYFDEDIIKKSDLKGDYFPANNDPYGEKIDVTGKCPAFKYNFPEADRWGMAHDAFIFGYLGNGYFDHTIPVKFNTEKKEIELLSFMKVGGKAYWNTYSFINLLEEMDSEDEYYIDSKTLMLFYYPKSDFSENTSFVISQLKTPMIAIENVRELEISGITIENARGIGIYFENSSYTKIESCVIRNLGMVGIDFGYGYKRTVNPIHNGKLIPESRSIGCLKANHHDNPLECRNGGYHNIVKDCEIYNTGTGGIILDGGDQYNLIRGYNAVVGCDIHDFNRLEKTYKPGVWVFGYGNRVSFSKIYNSPDMAVQVGGSENTVEYSEIYNCCTDCYDNGAFYCGYRYHSLNSFNTVIRGNYFHDNGADACELNEGARDFRSETYDLYFDGHCGTLVEGNIFASKNTESGVFVNICAFYDKVIGNIFIDCEGIKHREYALDYSYDAYEGVEISGRYIDFGFSVELKEKWKKTYPLLENYKEQEKIPYGGHEIRDNIHIGKGSMVNTCSEVFSYENNVHYDKIPKFLESILEKIKK